MNRPPILIAISLLAAMLLTLSGCGSDDPTATPTAAPAPGVTPEPAAPTPTATLAPGVTPPPATATPTPAPGVTPVPATPTPAPRPTPTPDPSFDAAAHFGGKTVRLVVPFGAGGGTDVQSRYFAAHLRDYIPGNPRIVVSNTPPQDAALNRLYNHIEPDGLTMLMTSGNRTQAQFESTAITFEFDKFRFINTFGSPAGISFVGNGYSYSRIQDAVGSTDDELIGMVAGPDEANSQLWAATSEFLNIPLRFILGPGSGTSQLYAAFDRGEINLIPRYGGILWYTVPVQRPGYITEGTFEPFCVCMPRGVRPAGNAESPLPDDVMNPIDLMVQHGVDQSDIEDLELLAEVTSRFAKMLVLPPETPQPVVDTLRKAFDDLLANPELNAEFSKLQGQPATITPGAEIEEILSRTVPRYGEIRDRFQRFTDLAEERLN